MNKEIKAVKKYGEAWKIEAKKPEWFSIVHTADKVDYLITNFRNKNQDFFSEELESVLLNTRFKEIKNIYENVVPKSKLNSQSKIETGKTLFQKFKNEMKTLMDVLRICDVSFIRCLKPNQDKQKENFKGFYVLQQIKYLGVLESIKIRKDGFPFRKDYKLFFQQYFELNIELDKKTEVNNFNSYSQTELKEKCWRILRNILFEAKDPKEKIFKEKVLFGHSKINAKQEIATILDKLMLDPNRKKILEMKLIQMKTIKSITVQSFCKMVVPRTKYLYKKLIVKKLNKTFTENWTKRTQEYVCILKNINKFCNKWKKVENKMIRFKQHCFSKYKQNAKLKSKFLNRRESVTQMNKIWEKIKLRHCLAKITSQVKLFMKIENFSVSIKNFQMFYKQKLDLFFMRCFIILIADRKAITEKFLKALNILLIICQKKLKMNFLQFKNNAFYQKENIIKYNNGICNTIPFSIGNSKLKKVFDENFSTPELTKIVLEKLYNKKLKNDYKAMQNKLLIFLKRKILKPIFQIFVSANHKFENERPDPPNPFQANQSLTALEIQELQTKLCGVVNLSSLKRIKHENYDFSTALLKKETQEFFSNDSYQTPIQKLIFEPEPNVVLYETVDDSIDALKEFDFEAKNIPEPLNVKSNFSFLSIFPRFSETNIDLKKKKREEEKSIEDINKLINKFYDDDLPEQNAILCGIGICQASSNSIKVQEEIYNLIIKKIEKYLENTKSGIFSHLLNIKKDYEGDFLKSLKLLIITTACLPSFKTQNSLITSLICKKVTETKTTEELKKYSCYTLRRLLRNINIKPKKKLPEKIEIQKVLRMKKITIRIKFIHEKYYKLQIETFDTVKDVLHQAIDKLELNHLAKFLGIYIDYEDGVFLEDESNFDDQLRYFSMQAKKNYNEINIFLRIKLFPLKNLFFNTDFVCLLYTQMFYSYLQDKYKLSKEAVYELSAWAFFINEGKYSGNQHIKIVNYCPLSYNKPETLIETTENIIIIYRNISENLMTKKIAMGNFISKLRQISDEMHYNFYGNLIKITVNKYNNILEEKISNEVILYVKGHELFVMNKNSNLINKEIFAYKNICSYGCYECLHIQKKLFAWREVGEHDYLYFFECAKSDQIERLMEGYLKLLVRNN